MTSNWQANIDAWGTSWPSHKKDSVSHAANRWALDSTEPSGRPATPGARKRGVTPV